MRVLTVTMAPGVEEPFHAHRYARWLPIGPPHALEHVDPAPLRIVRVELKKAREQIRAAVSPSPS